VEHHWDALRSFRNVDDSLKEQLATDIQTADITGTEKLMLAYALKITRDAASIDQAYIDALKAKGMSDDMLHDVVQVTSYFAYINRLADGLGVELEE
jgi:uncharacterized peroxidase-related enzyme